MGAILGLGCAVGARMVLRQPIYARVHATALQTSTGFWAGYQWNKWCSKKNLSEYKHAVDFAERHSVRKKLKCHSETSFLTVPEIAISITLD